MQHPDYNETPDEADLSYSEAAETPEDQSSNALLKENEELKAALQRLGADFANYQRRSLREKESWGDRQVYDTLLRLLPALDSLNMLLKQGQGEAWEKGAQLIYGEFEQFLRQCNVCKIEPKSGDKFDPNLHCCISVVEAEVEYEQIDCVVRYGYTRNSLVIRAAEVVVKKPSKKSQ